MNLELYYDAALHILSAYSLPSKTKVEYLKNKKEKGRKRNIHTLISFI